MFSEIRNELLGVVKSTPNGYMNKIKKSYPAFYHHLISLQYNGPGESFYNWVYPDCIKTCKFCNTLCNYKQFSYGYYEFCSCSCRAKFFDSNKNAHDENGNSKGKHKIKAKIVESRRKANDTCMYKYGTNASDTMKVSRAKQYINSIPEQLLNYDFCNTTTKSMKQLSIEFDIPFVKVRNVFKLHAIQPTKRRSPHSATEIELCNFLDDHSIPYTTHNRKILGNKLELDIWLPQYQIGIEYCGLFWHSDRNHYPPNKHQQKWLLAKCKNVTLITIFEDEWLFQRELVKSRLLSILHQHSESVHARICDVVINYDLLVIRRNLNNWHIAGSKSANNNICLVYNGEVVSILTYEKPRYSKDDIEIIRFASKPGLTVVGGFSKLFEQLIYYTTPTSVVSYSDNRWGLGNEYANIGFVENEVTPPSYFYFMVREKIRYHRSGFMKNHIVEQMNSGIELSEIENMRLLKYNRIFDCGTTKWIWNSNSHIDIL